ncbi:DUF2164 domain-containing protein [Paenibacillus hodogayensis]|uniref:DUF2164 domain-containing protein n=1 Tax=Paenibacillus hodogayensis TaxID=279208 RepID=A0ABV5W4Q9_9BACL
MMAIKLPKEQKDEIVKAVQAFFQEERSETIGALAAEQLIDFMVQQLGPSIYNQAIGDDRSIVNEKQSQLEDELYTLEKPLGGRRK